MPSQSAEISAIYISPKYWRKGLGSVDISPAAYVPRRCPRHPAEFGCWNSIYQKFNRWSSKGKWMAIFKSLSKEPDLEWEFIDGSIVKAHQYS